MNLVLHQLRTDFRHLRYWIAVFWATLPIQLLLPNLSRLPQNERFALELAFAGLQVFLAALIAVRAVHADAFVGDTAFWKTRPLTPASLWAAKSLLVALVLLGPLTLAELLLWKWTGVATAELLPAVASLWLIVLPWVAVVLGLAGATRNLAQFVAGAAGLFGAGFAVAMLLSFLQASAVFLGPSAEAARSTVIVTLGWPMLWGLLAWAGAGRRWRWNLTATLLAIAVIGAVVMPYVWCVNFFARPGLPEIRAQVTPLDADAPPPASADGQWLWSTFRVSGLPTNQVAATVGFQAVFQPDEGEALKFLLTSPWPTLWEESDLSLRDNTYDLSNLPQQDEYFGRIRAAFPADTLWFGHWPARRQAMLPIVIEGESVRLGDQGRGRFSGTLFLQIFEVRQLAELPLRRGVTRPEGNVRLVVREVNAGPRSIAVKLEERRSSFLLKPDDVRPLFALRRGFVYVLYQPATGEALVQDSGNSGFVTYDLYAGQAIRYAQLRFGFSRLRARLTGVRFSDWLKGARLHVFAARPVGVLTKRFNVANFHLNLGNEPEQSADRQALLAELEALTLAPDATPEEAGRYVERIETLGLELSGGNDGRRLRDKLMALGANHLDALIQRWPIPYRLRHSIGRPVLRQFAQPRHLPALEAALRRDPALVWLFQQRKWEAEARPVLRKLLPDLRQPVPAAALAIAADAAPPELYPILARRFVLLERGHEVVLPVLEKLDGFDTDTVVRAAWKRARLGLAEQPGLAPAAARLGLPGALDAAIGAIDRGRRSVQGDSWSRQLRQLTGYKAGAGEAPEAFRDWLLANWGHFRYEPAARSYRLE